MSTRHEVALCRYRYDAMDRLVESEPFRQSIVQCFFLKSYLVTQLQAQVQRSIFQNDDQLLAQQQRQRSGDSDCFTRHRSTAQRIAYD